MNPPVPTLIHLVHKGSPFAGHISNEQHGWQIGPKARADLLVVAGSLDSPYSFQITHGLSMSPDFALTFQAH